MKATLGKSLVRSSSPIRRLVVFSFPNIARGQSVFTGSFRAPNAVNFGEVIVSQRPASGSTAVPVVRYQIVNATTGRPVTNSVTVRGTRIVVLPFVVPFGTFRLKITNVGTGRVNVSGVILVF